MYKSFTVPLDQLNPEVMLVDVTINGKIYGIKRGVEIYACETTKEQEELKKKGYTVCPMGVYDVLKNAEII